MARVPHITRQRKKFKTFGKPAVVSRDIFESLELDARLELIRALIPIGLTQVQEELDRGGDLDEALFRRVLYGISCRNYEQAAEDVPGAIGLSSSSVSRAFVKASAKRLRQFQERDLSGLDLVVLFLDGKKFRR